MKKNWILAAAVACASAMGTMLTVNAAEEYRVYTVADARVARSVADVLQEESQSDIPPAAPMDEGVAPSGEGCANGACDTGACEEAEAEEEECLPCRLFNQDNCHGVKVYGWVNAGIFTNTRNTASRYNGPVTFADRNDGQLNQLYGVIEKSIDTEGCGWDFGGRFDVLYGSDWVYNTELGWEVNDGAAAPGAILDGWNSNPYMGLVTPQAYGEVGYNNLSVKVGRFYTPIGYEVVTAPNNFFATHAYTMQYGEPFSHSGALGTYKASDNWTFLGGIVNGWDRFDGPDDRASGIGGVIYTPDHEKYTLTLTGISGTEAGFSSGLSTTRNLYSFVFNYNVSDKWNYVFQHDHGWQQDSIATAPGGIGPTDAEWYGINQYLFYTINDCWKAGIRGEWFRDDDGARVAGVRPTDDGDLGNEFYTPGGYAGNFYEISLGLNWTPHANLIVRPEVRYDWFNGDSLNAIGGRPYGDGTDNSQWVYGLDAVVLW
jgi:hypothetical protein